MSNLPSFNYRSHGYSGEKALNEILDLLTFLYYSIVGGGLPVNTNGALPVKQDFTVSGGPIDCTGGTQTITVGEPGRQNYFKLVSLMFDSSVPRDVRISVILDGQPRTWIVSAAYVGPYIMVTDELEGQNIQLQIEVSQHAGSFTYAVAGETF